MTQIPARALPARAGARRAQAAEQRRHGFVLCSRPSIVTPVEGMGRSTSSVSTFGWVKIILLVELGRRRPGLEALMENLWGIPRSDRVGATWNRRLRRGLDTT